MDIILIDEQLNIENKDTYSVCLGMFDGVHIGHRRLVNKAIELAKENNIKSAVLTFLTPFENNRVYPFEKNMSILEGMGIDTVFVINLTEKFKSHPEEVFIKKYLIEYIKAKHIICGFNFRFGKDRHGDIETLKEHEGNDYKLTVIPEVTVDDKTVSSTRIRACLKEGEISKANELLGSCYSITGSVCEGKKLGREINFPTINIPVCKSLAPLKAGVYSSKVEIDGKLYDGISNIGVAPTVRDKEDNILETYIMDFSGDLYNKVVRVYIIGFIREEKKFNSLDELKSTIKENIEIAKEQLNDFRRL